jgi:energy-converting hydrogenase B subunit D
MTAELFLDGVLVCSLVIIAFWAVTGGQLFRSVVLFITFGLLMSISWMRLEAPDIALAEAAIGAGLMGVLLLDTLGYIRRKAGAAGKSEDET